MATCLQVINAAVLRNDYTGVVWAQDYLLEYRNSTRAQPIYYME